MQPRSIGNTRCECRLRSLNSTLRVKRAGPVFQVVKLPCHSFHIDRDNLTVYLFEPCDEFWEHGMLGGVFSFCVFMTILAAPLSH